MNLSPKAIISPEKLKKYLLTYKLRNDKSRWLAHAGYELKNWKLLEYDLRNQILTLNAKPGEENPYGQIYEIRGTLIGQIVKVYRFVQFG